MAMITKTSPKIFTGTPKVMRRAPPQRVERRVGREIPQKEIGIIAESQKIAETRADRRRRVDETIPMDLGTAIQQVKDSGVTGAEAGYQLNRLIYAIYGGDITKVRTEAQRKARSEFMTELRNIKASGKDFMELQAERREATEAAIEQFKTGVLAGVPVDLRSWFDKQIAEYRRVMAECDAEYKKELEKIKDKYGDDPKKYTDAKLKLQAKIYPKWSSTALQAIAKFEERQDKMAAAVSAAKKSGVKGLSSDEIYALATSTKKSADKRGAELGLTTNQIAAIRGEKLEVITGVGIGAGAGIIIEPELEEKPVTTLSATAAEKKKAEDAMAEANARGWSCYAKLANYKVKLKDGTVIKVEAFSKGAAEDKAEAAGYKVAYATKMFSRETIEPSKIETGAFNVTVDGKTTTMVPFTEPNTGDILLMPINAADQLKDTQAYKAATGTDEDKLGIAYDTAQKDFQKWLIKLNKEDPELFLLYHQLGYEALENAIQVKQEQYETILPKLKPYKKEEGYDLATALFNKSVTPDELRAVGFWKKDVDEATDSAKYWQDLETAYLKLSPGEQAQYMKDHRIYATYSPKDSMVSIVEQAKPLPKIDGPYDKLSNEHKLLVLQSYAHNRPEAAGKRAIETGKFALAFVPIAGTIAYWGEMSPAMRALSIAGDILIIVPIIKGATIGARAAAGYTRGARMLGALKGAGKMVLAEVTAPAEILAHPVQTAKGVGRQVQSILETLVHPKKIPLGAAELAYTTTRLPIDDVGDARKAMQLRDAAVDAAIHGKKATATIGDVTLTLTPSELQKVGGAMAVHATPDIRPYLNGAVVKGGIEGSGVFISPNFHSRFAQATAFGDIPEGGIKGGLIIRDPDVLKAIAPSGKIYRSAAELEAILKPGTKLPAPSQILITRDATGYKLTLLVIGEPFTQPQIAKLKLLGSVDTIGQIFKPTMTLTGAQRTAISSMDDIIDLSRERIAIVQQLTAARAAGKSAQVQVLSQRLSDIDSKISDLIERVNIPREVVRASDIVWGQYADKGILDRWREINPQRVTRTATGTRLPEIRTDITATREIPTRTRRTAISRPYLGISKRTDAEPYKPITARDYTPTKVPPYAPPYAPTYAPPHLPPRIPPYAPPYIPPRVPPVRPPLIPPIAPPTKPPKQPPKLSIKLERARVPAPGQALQVWNQGAYWITILEPFRTKGNKPDVIYSRSKPPWAGRTVKGRRSPQKTFRSLGRRHPKLVELPMGVATARVQNGKRLVFSRGSR